MAFQKGNPYRFTSQNRFVFLPGRQSAMWGNLVSEIRAFQRGSRFKHTVIDIDPTTYNSASIATLLSLNRIQTSRRTREALDEVGHYLIGTVIPRMFEEEESSEGPWEPLKDSTLAWRRAMRYDEEPILQASGALYQEATSENAIVEVRGGRNPRVVVGGSNFTGGSPERAEPNNVYKYFVHMAGGSPSNVPPRPFMPQTPDDLTDEEQDHIKDIFNAHIWALMGD